MSKFLVVANQTALSPELTNSLLEKSKNDPQARFILVVPATPLEHLLSREAGDAAQIAARRAGQALIHLTNMGIPMTGAHVGGGSLTMAIDEAIGPHQKDFAGIILCTFPPGSSRWLDRELSSSLEKAFHLPVTHVVARPSNH